MFRQSGTNMFPLQLIAARWAGSEERPYVGPTVSTKCAADRIKEDCKADRFGQAVQLIVFCLTGLATS